VLVLVISYKYLNKKFLNKETIDKLSKAITYYAFRSGPIEDMHVIGILLNLIQKYLIFVKKESFKNDSNI